MFCSPLLICFMHSICCFLLSQANGHCFRRLRIVDCGLRMDKCLIQNPKLSSLVGGPVIEIALVINNIPVDFRLHNDHIPVNIE
jgi:hypothetical protein